MKRCGRCGAVQDVLDEYGLCSGCRSRHDVNLSINASERPPMFRVNVVYTAAGHRPQVFADLRLSDRYTMLVWEGEPVDSHHEAEEAANLQVEEAVRRLFWGGNVGQSAKKMAVEDAPPA